MSRTGIAAVAAAAVAFGAAAVAGPASLAAAAAATPPTAKAVPRGVMPLPSTRHPRSSASSAGPHLSYFGGKVVAAVQVVEVLYGGGVYEAEVTASTAPSIASFYAGVTNSPYLDWMSEYNTTVGAVNGHPGTNQIIGRGAFVSRIQVTPSAANDPANPTNADTISDAQIQDELHLQITGGNLPAATANTLYAIYFPAGVTITMPGPGGTTQHSGVDFCAYHGTISSPEAYYSVLPDFNTGGMAGCGNGSDSEFQRVTAVSSHELAEVITDPEVGLATSFAPPLAWYDASNNQEAADLCEGTANPEAAVLGGDGNVYTVQTIWSNRQRACVVAPAAPPPPPFTPQGVGAPAVAVGSDGTQLVFWKGSDNHLTEAYYTNRWNGPVDDAGFGTLTSAPSVAFTRDGSNTQVVFWEGPGGHLMEAWYSNGWNGPVDWTASAFGGQGLMASAPSVATFANGEQAVFWRGTDGHLLEAWYANGWNGPVDYASFGQLASAPSIALSPNGTTQVVVWNGPDNHLTEAWYANGWNGPADWTGLGTLSSAPSVAFLPNGTQIIFFAGAGGHLVEDWYSTAWNGPVDVTASSFAGSGGLTSAPAVAVTPGGSAQLVFWQGAGASLWEAWYAGGWNGPADYSGG